MPPFDLVEKKRRWKVSCAWLTKHFNCTPEHITDPNGCGGKCCRNPSLWPPKAFPGNVCGYLSDTGCILALRNRPITCILFPIVPLKTAPFDPDNNTLVMYQRAIFPTSMCKGAYKNGPMVIDMCRRELILIFGEAEYNRVRADLVAGRDSYLDMPDHIVAEFQRDIAEDDYEHGVFTPPKPRTYLD